MKKQKGVLGVGKRMLHALRKRVVRMGTLRAVLWVTGTAEVMAVALGWVLIHMLGYSHEVSNAIYMATATIPLIVAPIVGGTIMLLLEDLEEARTVLEDMATRDGLTTLYNRTYFMDQLRREISKAHRYEMPLSLLMFDVDDFKRVNDRYGHSSGDHVLESIAKTCTGLLREHDVLARYGGEEFVLLLAGTGEEGARQVAEKLRAAIEEMIVPVGRSKHAIKITVSIGGAVLRYPEDTVDTLFGRADEALYRSKLAGKNRWNLR